MLRTTGLPIGLSVAALSVAFNWKFADWASGVKSSRGFNRHQAAANPNSRSDELKRHGILIGLGALGLASSAMGPSPLMFLKQGLEVAREPKTMAVAGLAWGGAVTIASAVAQEWDHYDDGWKVAITGGSLAGLLAMAAYL